jgi:hypothetical protein
MVAFGELHRRAGRIQPGEQQDRKGEGDDRDQQRERARLQGALVAEEQRAETAEDRQPDQQAQQGQG